MALFGRTRFAGPLPSPITQMLAGYRHVLEKTRTLYDGELRSQIEAAQAFHDAAFKHHVRSYHDLFVPDSNALLNVRARMRHFFNTEDLTFVAIDGASLKEAVNRYVVFFGCSYGVKGSISLSGSPAKVRYTQWSPNEDISYAAYLPVPVTRMSRYVDDYTLNSDEETIDYNQMHRALTLLAEVYLAHSLAQNPVSRPNLILLDNRLGGLLIKTTIPPEDVHMRGHPRIPGGLKAQHVVLANSRPYSDELDIPFPKLPEFYQYALRVLEKHGAKKMSELAAMSGNSVDDIRKKLKSRISPATSRSVVENEDATPLLSISSDADEVVSFNQQTYGTAWRDLVRLFTETCENIFKEKDAGAMQYEAVGTHEPRWLTPNDLYFLAGVGARNLMEICWKERIMLLGISKESNSRYLSRNFFGVRKLIEPGFVVPEHNGGLSDRMLCELVPHFDHTIESPWSTIEIDASFMTVHAHEHTRVGGAPQVYIEGVKGSVVQPQPRLVAVSFAQFFLEKTPGEPYGGDVIQIDRLVHKTLDQPALASYVIKDRSPPLADGTPQRELGELRPLFYKDNRAPNDGQDIAMLALKWITRNLYPDFIGMPDPLHKAGWGAKSLANRVKPVIQSSNGVVANQTIRRIMKDMRKEAAASAPP